jgi:IMP dehydrogenase
MARQGGLGIIHRFMDIQAQSNEILKVKRSGVFMNPNPVTIGIDCNFKMVKFLMKKYGITSFLVINTVSTNRAEDSPRITYERKKALKGILTQRDINCFKFDDELVKDFMTPIDKVIYYEVSNSFDAKNCDLNSIL